MQILYPLHYSRSAPIKPISHLDFMEKIAEGFVIEAYNSTKSRDVDRISLASYNLQMLEQALAEMRGEAPPSTRAQGGVASAAQSGSEGGKAVKRKLEVPCGGRGKRTFPTQLRS